MNLLVITRHEELIERLRMAFEGSGHRIIHAGDPLEALALDAWGESQVLLVDATGDPMDGFRLCRLLRGEARVLFRNLPIYLIMEHPPTPEDLQALHQADGDGFIRKGATLQQLLNLLGPVLDGGLPRSEGQRVPVLAMGLSPALVLRARSLLRDDLMEIHTVSAKAIGETQRVLNAPILLLGLSAGGLAGALASLAQLREQGRLPHTILIGQVRDEAAQRRLLLAGVADWVPLPLSGPRLMHACRRALEWMHARRIQVEFEAAIHDLRERRAMLEIEAASLRSEVLTDPLTELLNRRAFDQHLAHALRQWERSGRPFVLLLGDIDHFKLINDRFGHPVGDDVLRQMATQIRSSLRKSDLAFRVGGEEFAVLLNETSLKSGAEVAEKLRQRIDQEPVVLQTGQSIFPTMSFGVVGPGPQDALGLLALVDKALYQAKRLGRNRVVVSDGVDVPLRTLSAGN